MTTPHHDPERAAQQQPAAEKPAGTRVSPIIWGTLILAFCGYIAQRAFGGAGIDSSWWIIATVMALGVLLLGVGLAVILRGRRR